ncbi:tape measure protein [Acinetobacter baumannii]|uniref:tape measure protein n=2 Tax=Moraxellaceae TaxID=468 RepID=UPI0003F95DA6|nr:MULTISPECIES: tape measure protein [Acinetobacter]EHU1907383.1 tape measure protein [Acinetobacter baumannii]KAF6698549.1 tape measure protein [Acinetobacter sp. EKM10A]KRI32579.1 phage tail tape measure protein [Acinetobacter baumannii]MDN8364635.1 tape measure protein [Acinetobacter baumannii]OTT31220.1 phage tail tape measure protein [Acinetobacter baumannii]
MAQESRLVIVIDSQNAERNARNLGNELVSIERKGDYASKSMDGLSVATRALAGYMAGLVTVGAAISKMDTYTGLQNRLKLVTNNQAELNKATEDTFQIAQKTYSAWDSVLQVYQRFSDNAKTLNLTMDDTARLTETVSKAVAISGASAEAADAALVQFGQALASGTLRGEELNSVMEQTPALAKAIAQGMGITVGELRSVAAEGKITSQEIVKALRNVEKDVDALFAKTDITIGQSLTLLNNEITKFVGESGKGSGAAQVLAGNIQTLAGNLDVLTSAMMVGGAYWLGTYIPAIYASGVAVAAKIKELAAQTVTQYAAIQAERAAAAQQVISTQTVVANTQATLAAIAAEKALEVQRLKSQITEKGRTATLTRMAELKKIEAQVTRELALAEEALAVAQSRSAAAGAASVGIGSRLLGLLGGPVGMGITVASLAAGYLLMRDNGDKANDMLEKQSRYASMAADELMKLEGAQKRAAEDELTKQLSLQNAQLSKSQNEFLLLTQSITDNNKQSAEAYRIWAELKTGVIDVNQAFNRLNQLSFISSDQINQLADSKKKVDENTKAVKQTNSELNQVRTSGANAKAGFNDVSQGAKGAVQDVTELNKKLKDINKSLADRKWDAAFKTTLIKKYGRSVEEADLLLQTYRENQKKGYSGVTVEQDKIIKGIVAQENALEALVNKDKARTKELEKQEKVSKRLIGISGQSGIGTGPHLDVRYGGSMSGQKVSNEHLARLQAGGKPLTSYKISSNYGPRKAPTKGASSFHKGIDFSMPEGTPITTNVAVKDIKTWYDSKGGGYVSEVIFEDGVSLKLLHQSPKMQSKVKGGASKGSDKAAGDIQSQLDRQLDAQRSLENEVASEVQRIQNNLKVRLEDVDKAGFSPERTAEIKAELQRRADNDVDIAKQAIRSKLEDYKEFRKTEEQLLEESFNRKKFNAAHDIELSKSEQKQAVELLEQQKQQELGLLKLAQEQRLFQARLSLLSETQAMQERYRLEREEILKNTKLSIEERQKLIALSKANQDKETRDKVNNAVQNWGGIQADMNGTGEFFRQDQERFSRLNAANDLADSQFAATDLNEQNSLDGLNAQFEAGLIKQQDYENQKTAIIQAAQDQRNQIAAEYAKNAQDIEDKYQQDRLNTQIAFGGQMMGSLTSMFGSMFGEQSKAYKIMFVADKAYAIAAAGIAIQQNIAAASKAGFPLNLPLIAGAVAQGASIIANIRAIKDQGFADGGYTGSGGKYQPAGIVHKGEVVWSQEDIKRWGGVGLVEKMRKSANPEAFLNNNASVDSVMRRAMMSSSAFIESQKQADIFNQLVQDTQIIYKGNRDTPKLVSSANSDLFHDGKVYFSSNGLVQDRSNLDDVQDFTLGRTSRPQAEIMPSIKPSSPIINFKIEVINQMSGATVEAEQLDEQTVRIIVKDELDKQLPRTVPKLVSDQIGNPNSTISRSLTENTTARRNRT